MGLSLVLILGWRQFGAVIRDPVELFPFPSCPWAAVGTWICPLQPVTFPPCSALESLEAFSKRRKPSNRSETLWGAQHDLISPGRTSWSCHFLQCEQYQTRAGVSGVDPANNNSFEPLTFTQKSSSDVPFITLSVPPRVFETFVLGLFAPGGSSSSFPVLVFQAEHRNANRPACPGPGQAEASPATAALFFLLHQSGCWWRLHVPVGVQDSCSSQPEGANGPGTATTCVHQN